MDATSVGTTGGQANSGSTGATNAGTIGDGGGLFSGSLGASSLLVGDANAAITFTGSSGNTHDPVSCPADATNLQPASAFTIACLIKPTTLDAINGNMLCCYGDSTGTAAYFLAVNGAGTLHLFFDGTASAHRNLTSAGTVVNGNTYFLVATYDGTTMKIYINGVQDANTTAISTSVIYTDVTSPEFSFGGWGLGATGGTSNFNGVLDEGMFFSGVALTQAQITALYNGAQNISASPTVGLFHDTVYPKARNASQAFFAERGNTQIGPSPQGFRQPFELNAPARRYNSEGWSYVNGKITVGPANLSVAFQPPVEFFPHGRYHPEGWQFASGVSIVGPSPRPLLQSIVLMDVDIRRRYNAEGWSWSGVFQNGPQVYLVPAVVDPRIKARYNAEGWAVVSGARSPGPAPTIIVPQPDFLTVSVRRTDGWYTALVPATKGPTPQAIATFLDSFVHGRYNADGFAAPSGVRIVGPAPHWAPPAFDPIVHGRYNSEAFFAIFGNGISGPQPGPSTKTVTAADRAATMTEAIAVTKPQSGIGPIIVPFFRGF